MNKILVPTDFSKEADKSLQVAKSIALKTGAEIHFLHAIAPIHSYGYNMTGGSSAAAAMDDLFVMKLIERNKALLSQRANSSELMNITTHMHLQVGEVFPTLAEYVEKHNIDLIVMGSKGSSGLEEVIIGSNAERVVRLSTCPVLVVKDSHPDFEIQNIVLATNGEENSEALVATVKSFQKVFGASLHLLNVNTPNNFYRTRTMQAQLRAFAEKNGLEDYTIHIYNDSDEVEGITSFAEDFEACLIAMGTHGRTGLSRVLSGSLAEDVVNHSQRPTLTARFA